MATLESLSELAQLFPNFAAQSLDFVVDMFNDEIEDIRLKAIQCLAKIGRGDIILREDQIEIILAVIEDSNMDIREALHEMLGNCKISTKTAVRYCIDSLLDSMKKYPQDRLSIWTCFKKLGTNHPHHIAPLVPELLGIHPFLHLPEPSLEDTAYLGILVLVFNATAKFPIIQKLFERHTVTHYAYLRDSYPSLVPSIKAMSNDLSLQEAELRKTLDVTGHASSFLLKLFVRIRTTLNSDLLTINNQISVIELSIR